MQGRGGGAVLIDGDAQGHAAPAGLGLGRLPVHRQVHAGLHQPLFVARHQGLHPHAVQGRGAVFTAGHAQGDERAGLEWGRGQGGVVVGVAWKHRLHAHRGHQAVDGDGAEVLGRRVGKAAAVEVAGLPWLAGGIAEGAVAPQQHAVPRHGDLLEHAHRHHPIGHRAVDPRAPLGPTDGEAAQIDLHGAGAGQRDRGSVGCGAVPPRVVGVAGGEETEKEQGSHGVNHTAVRWRYQPTLRRHAAAQQREQGRV
jgi:hypothetical protein